jgi:hypothetical protein
MEDNTKMIIGKNDTGRIGLMHKMQENTSKKKCIGLNSLFLVIANAFCLAILSFNFVMSYLARPIADDLLYFARTDDGVFKEIRRHYTFETGRYAQNVLTRILYKLFGVHSVQFFPIFLVAFTVFAFYVFCRLFIKCKVAALLCAFMSTIIITYGGIVMFDDYYWLTASTVYALPIPTFLLCIVLIKKYESTRSKFLLILITFLVFINQGFCEIPALLIAAYYTYTLIFEALKRRKLYYIAPTIASYVGCLLLVISPASLARRKQLSGGANPFYTGIKSLIKGISLQLENINIPIVLLAVLLGVIMSIFIVKGLLSIPKIFFAGTSIAIIIPLASDFIFGFISGANIFPRAFLFSSSGFYLGISILAWFLFELIKRNFAISGRSIQSAIKVSCCLIAIGSILVIPQASLITKAMSLRNSMLTSREAIVQKELSAGEKEITVHPAPILLPLSSATDFSFSAKAKGWYSGGWKKFYHIPKDTKIIIDRTQPIGYCINGKQNNYSGAKPCSELS